MDRLFQGWKSPMVQACLQGHMGRLICRGEGSALASIGDFCFLAGAPCAELVERADAPILVPDGEGWRRIIEEVLGREAVPFTRYATRHAPERFDCDRLICLTKALPQGFALHPIGREMYFTLLEEEWARDLCGCFGDASGFLEQGLGFVVTLGGNLPVAGVSSYAVCDGAIEIEIDTRPDFRRLGLAAACGARLVLECLGRGLYPGWDAHNEQSLALAEKLGYQLDRPYTAYWVAKNREHRRNLSVN